MPGFEEHMAKRGTVSTLRSPRFAELQAGYPVCKAPEKIPFNAPKGGDRGKCLFCECPAEAKVGRWYDNYERFDEKRFGWLEVSICSNCEKHYLDEDGHLAIGDLLVDSGEA